jgi:CDP-diglyceride synthetase
MIAARGAADSAEHLEGRMTVTRWVLIALHTILGVAAVGAGQAFVRVPSGAALGMTTEWLDGSPFPDFRFPGLFLAVVIGGANSLTAVLLWRRHPGSPLASLGTGLLLVIWVAIQTAIIGFRHWSQGIWWVTFVLVTVLAARLVGQRDRNTPSTLT